MNDEKDPLCGFTPVQDELPDEDYWTGEIIVKLGNQYIKCEAAYLKGFDGSWLIFPPFTLCPLVAWKSREKMPSKEVLDQLLPLEIY